MIPEMAGPQVDSPVLEVEQPMVLVKLPGAYLGNLIFRKVDHRSDAPFLCGVGSEF